MFSLPCNLPSHIYQSGTCQNNQVKKQHFHYILLFLTCPPHHREKDFQNRIYHRLPFPSHRQSHHFGKFPSSNHQALKYYVYQQTFRFCRMCGQIFCLSLQYHSFSDNFFGKSTLVNSMTSHHHCHRPSAHACYFYY